MIFGIALADRGQKDRTYFPELENIDVEILVLSLVALISNIGLLTAEALADDPNEKEPTLNAEPSYGNDEVTYLESIPPSNIAEGFNRNLIMQRRLFLLEKQILSICWMKVVLVLLLK